MKLKRLLIIGLSSLMLGGLASCGEKPQPSETSQPVSEQVSSEDGGWLVSEDDESEEQSQASSSSSSSQAQQRLKEYGEKTDTSIEISLFYNQSQNETRYGIYHLEPGSSINVDLSDFDAFTCFISGFTFTHWSYDIYGTQPVTSQDVFNEPTNIYANHYPRQDQMVEVRDLVEEKACAVSWKPGYGVSFSLKDGGALPQYADEGQELVFKLVKAYNVKPNQDEVVKVNGEAIELGEDSYYHVVCGANIEITTNNLEMTSDKIVDMTVYLYVNGEQKGESLTYKSDEYGAQYYVTGVELVKDDTVMIKDEDGKEYPLTENIGSFTAWKAPYDGSYDFYFKVAAKVTYVAVPRDPDAVSRYIIQNYETQEVVCELFEDGTQDFQGRDQAVAKGVQLTAGTKIRLFNTEASEGWIVPIDSWSFGQNTSKYLEAKKDYWEVKLDCRVDVYAKFKFGDDQIYFGKA